MCAIGQLVVDRRDSPSGNQCRQAAMCFFYQESDGVYTYSQVSHRQSQYQWLGCSGAFERQQEGCVKEPSKGYRQHTDTSTPGAFPEMLWTGLNFDSALHHSPLTQETRVMSIRWSWWQVLPWDTQQFLGCYSVTHVLKNKSLNAMCLFLLVYLKDSQLWVIPSEEVRGSIRVENDEHLCCLHTSNH